jgi:hypothetical protein
MTDRTPVLYRASPERVAVADDERAEPALMPCFQLTGFGSAENTLSVARDGTVFVAPVFTEDGAGFLRTKNHGESFEVILPGERGGRMHHRMQPYLYMDPVTERLFYWTTANPSLRPDGFDLSISSDLGETFRGSTMGVGSFDWLKAVAAPPVTSEPIDYPNVLYAMAPTPTSTPVPVIGPNPEYQQVLRSLDGGATWESVGGMQLSLHGEDHDCAAEEWVIYGAGVALSDGTLYFGLRRCTRLSIAISRDEGASWTLRDLPGAQLVAYGGLASHVSSYNLLVTEPFAVDRDDNLYALWVDQDDVLRYAVSRDRAETWSTPVAVNAPEAPRAVFGSIAVREPGTIAIAYYGGDGQAYEGYIAESTDALEARPHFASFAISEPEGPLFSGGFDIGYVSPTGAIAMGDLIEIVQVKYAPNGDIWAAFVKDMCEGMSNNCSWNAAEHAMSYYQGAVGRVVHRVR